MEAGDKVDSYDSADVWAAADDARYGANEVDGSSGKGAV